MNSQKNNIIEKLNYFGKLKQKIFFIIDYGLDDFYINLIENIGDEVLFFIDGYTNSNFKYIDKNIKFYKYPIDINRYKKHFYFVKEQIKKGDTYLLNLTAETKIKTNLTIKEIYYLSKSKFKIYKKDDFVCFSPERFINIQNQKIYTYPMKGTIDASIKDAKSKILNDKKELAEHTMVVDLLRNDLAIIANNVTVDSFRYIDTIKSNNKKLLQVSSKISAKLSKNWQNNLGNILVSMLPAGSITGAPKKKTIEIIDKIEKHKRGYFTGICGYFDGENLDSAVMIRFIKQKDNKLVYKSGGGITISSNLEDEYQELVDKVYLSF